MFKPYRIFSYKETRTRSYWSKGYDRPTTYQIRHIIIMCDNKLYYSKEAPRPSNLIVYKPLASVQTEEEHKDWIGYFTSVHGKVLRGNVAQSMMEAIEKYENANKIEHQWWWKGNKEWKTRKTK